MDAAPGKGGGGGGGRGDGCGDELTVVVGGRKRRAIKATERNGVCARIRDEREHRCVHEKVKYIRNERRCRERERER